MRHARPVRAEAIDGQAADPILAERGHRQARATARYLASQGIHHVVSSSMKRAIQTAEPLADRLGLEIEMLDDLRESDHRAQAYIPLEEWDSNDPALAKYYDPDADITDTIFSDGYENFRECVERGFDYIIDTNRSRKVAVYCHGMVTSVYMQILLGFDDPMKVLVDYCGITRVEASSKGLRTVRSMNETQHVRHLLER